jgi:hypothetical protein
MAGDMRPLTGGLIPQGGDLVAALPVETSAWKQSIVPRATWSRPLRRILNYFTTARRKQRALLPHLTAVR